MEIAVINTLQSQFDKRQGKFSKTYLKTRQKALDYVIAHDFPGRKDEDYKYTPIDRILKKNFDFTKTVLTDRTDFDFKSSFYDLKGNHLVICNGNYLPEKSIILDDICCSLQKGSNAQFKDVFGALNIAFCEKKLNIDVPENYRSHPFFIYNFYDSQKRSVFGNPNIEIRVRTNSRIEVLEKTITQGENAVFINKNTTIHLETGASANITKIQNYPKNIFQVYNLDVNQEKESLFNSNVYSFSGGLIRNNLNINQLGEHCESHMHGLYLITGNCHVDNHTTVDHTMPNCYSNELYKGILDEQAKGVFNGKIYVRPYAQKTNAFQSNQNINLSDSASIYTKPQLEIWADDVKCSHGCTIGQLDQEALFYLRSRGIDKPAAKALILIAFAEQSLEYIPFDFVNAEIDVLIHQRLIG
jgi:Fe-S cluster assembly protein SufD|tara:strand:- start:11198 stop:12439 length:1242 start_codon:yes stop_codon:yes gene_type:complete